MRKVNKIKRFQNLFLEKHQNACLKIGPFVASFFFILIFSIQKIMVRLHAF